MEMSFTSSSVGSNGEFAPLEILGGGGGFTSGSPVTVPRAQSLDGSVSSSSQGPVVKTLSKAHMQTSVGDDDSTATPVPLIPGFIRLRKDLAQASEEDATTTNFNFYPTRGPISFLPVRHGPPPPKVLPTIHRPTRGEKDARRARREARQAAKDSSLLEHDLLEEFRGFSDTPFSENPALEDLDGFDFDDGGERPEFNDSSVPENTQPQRKTAAKRENPLPLVAFVDVTPHSTPAYLRRLRKYNTALNPVQRVMTLEASLNCMLDPDAPHHKHHHHHHHKHHHHKHHHHHHKQKRKTDQDRADDLMAALNAVPDPDEETSVASLESESTLSTAAQRAEDLKKMRLGSGSKKVQTNSQRKRAMLAAERGKDTRIIPIVTHGKSAEQFKLKRPGKENARHPDLRPGSVPIDKLALYSPTSFRMPVMHFQPQPEGQEFDDEKVEGAGEGVGAGATGSQIDFEEGLGLGMGTDTEGLELDSEWGFALGGVSPPRNAAIGNNTAAAVDTSAHSASNNDFPSAPPSRDGTLTQSRGPSRGEIHIPVASWHGEEEAEDPDADPLALNEACRGREEAKDPEIVGTIGNVEGSSLGLEPRQNKNFGAHLQASRSVHSASSVHSTGTNGLEGHASLLRSQIDDNDAPASPLMSKASINSLSRSLSMGRGAGDDGGEGAGGGGDGGDDEDWQNFDGDNDNYADENENDEGSNASSQRQRQLENEGPPQFRPGKVLTEEEAYLLSHPYEMFGPNLDPNTGSYRGYQFPRDGKLNVQITNQYIKYRDYPHDPVQLAPKGNFVTFNPETDRLRSPPMPRGGTPRSPSPSGTRQFSPPQAFEIAADSISETSSANMAQEMQRQADTLADLDLTVPTMPYSVIMAQTLAAAKARANESGAKGDAGSLASSADGSLASTASLQGKDAPGKNISLSKSKERKREKLREKDKDIPSSQRARIIFEAQKIARQVAAQEAAAAAARDAARKEEEDWKRMKALGMKRPPRKKKEDRGPPITIPPAYAIVPQGKGGVGCSLSASLKPPANATPLSNISRVCELIKPPPSPRSAHLPPIESEVPIVERYGKLSVVCRENEVGDPPMTPGFVLAALKRSGLRPVVD